jgi:hypothetical protein
MLTRACVSGTPSQISPANRAREISRPSAKHKYASSARALRLLGRTLGPVGVSARIVPMRWNLTRGCGGVGSWTVSGLWAGDPKRKGVEPTFALI